ncbi:hypothetical protein AB0K43_11525 [Kitasatospora sp. NPDC049258]|uniref:hypothetical protein n=1 Tax=Kitasatospora sp. NPDC049258 TaxID=3155394 RepID=UPI00343DC3FD
MSIATHDSAEVNGWSGRLTVGPGLRPARPRDLLRLPVFAVPRAADTDDPEADPATDPEIDPEERRRMFGGHCRAAMGYLD